MTREFNHHVLFSMAKMQTARGKGVRTRSGKKTCPATHRLTKIKPYARCTKRHRGPYKERELKRMCLAYDRLIDYQCDLLVSDTQHTTCPKNTALMSTNELWYHIAATSKLYLDLGRPLPESARKWAREQVAQVEQVSFLDPPAYNTIPMLKLVTIYGIYYGVHGQLESFYLATNRLNHDNIAGVAKRMCVVLSMRDYIDRHWDELIVEGVTQNGPRLRRGEFGVAAPYHPRLLRPRRRLQQAHRRPLQPRDRSLSSLRGRPPL